MAWSVRESEILEGRGMQSRVQLQRTMRKEELSKKAF